MGIGLGIKLRVELIRQAIAQIEDTSSVSQQYQRLQNFVMWYPFVSLG
ncbi:hypothetical protein [Nostoc sp.]